MARHLAARLLATAPTLFLVSLLVFSMIHLIPGDPVDYILGEGSDPAARAALARELGLDRPLPAQYTAWLLRALRGDLGRSINLEKPVGRAIAEKLPATLTLAALSLAVSLAIGLPAGLVAAARRRTAWDYGAMGVALFGISVPNFWLGILLILVFSLWLGWLPSMGYVEPWADPLRALRHALLPAVTLGMILAGVVMRMTRSTLLEELSKEYVRTAEAKGLPRWRVVLVHAQRNALIPTLTVVGLQAGYLLGGTVVVEQLFNWPGLGWLLLRAILARDYPLVQGIILVVACAFVLVNLAVDLGYRALDPRIRQA